MCVTVNAFAFSVRIIQIRSGMSESINVGVVSMDQWRARAQHGTAMRIIRG